MARTKGAKNGQWGNSIDKGTFERLCGLMCTDEEVAGVLGVSHDTLLRWIRQEYGQEHTFKSASNQFGAKRKAKLRDIQFKLAEENSAMAIFLGKQYLGQKDVIENTNVEKVAIVNDMPQEDDEQ
jgi:hypothetical protein